MEKGFRTIACRNEECTKRLRFPVTPARYGKEGIVKCPHCGTENRVAIPFPAVDREEPKAETRRSSSIFDDLFGDTFKKK